MPEEEWGAFEHPDGRRMAAWSRRAAHRLEGEGFLYRGLMGGAELAFWLTGGA